MYTRESTELPAPGLCCTVLSLYICTLEYKLWNWSYTTASQADSSGVQEMLSVQDSLIDWPSGLSDILYL